MASDQEGKAGVASPDACDASVEKLAVLLEERLQRLESKLDSWGEALQHQIKESGSSLGSRQAAGVARTQLTANPQAPSRVWGSLGWRRSRSPFARASSEEVVARGSGSPHSARGLSGRSTCSARPAQDRRATSRATLKRPSDPATREAVAKRETGKSAARSIADVLRSSEQGDRTAHLWAQYSELALRGGKLEDDSKPPSRFALNVVSRSVFDYTIGAVIIFTAFNTGAQVHHESKSSVDVPFFRYAEYICMGVFTTELILRFAAHGVRFFQTMGCIWACLDISLVILSFVDVILATLETETQAQTGPAKLLKIIRMARIMRVIRMLRLFGELRVMLQMVVNSLLSLFWLMVFLLFLLYVFAILLTKGATDYLKPGDNGQTPDPDIAANLREDYGSLFRTMYTLFKGMAGGISWGEIAEPMLECGVGYFLLILLFLCFAIFSVLNIITGVFVDGAIELAKRDRSIIIEKETQARKAVASHLLELLEAIDSNGDGTISSQEFIDALDKQEVVQFIHALQVDFEDARHLFAMLDRDNDGTVDVVEFVDGMQRLKGEARSADVHRLSLEVRMVIRILATVFPEAALEQEYFRTRLRSSTRAMVMPIVRQTLRPSQAAVACSKREFRPTSRVNEKHGELHEVFPSASSPRDTARRVTAGSQEAGLEAVQEEATSDNLCTKLSL